METDNMKVKGPAGMGDHSMRVQNGAYREPAGRGEGTAGAPASLDSRQGLWGSSRGVQGLGPGMLQGLFRCHPLVWVPLQAGLRAMFAND